MKAYERRKREQEVTFAPLNNRKKTRQCLNGRLTSFNAGPMKMGKVSSCCCNCSPDALHSNQPSSLYPLSDSYSPTEVPSSHLFPSFLSRCFSFSLPRFAAVSSSSVFSVTLNLSSLFYSLFTCLSFQFCSCQTPFLFPLALRPKLPPLSRHLCFFSFSWLSLSIVLSLPLCGCCFFSFYITPPTS